MCTYIYYHKYNHILLANPRYSTYPGLAGLPPRSGLYWPRQQRQVLHDQCATAAMGASENVLVNG